MPEFEPARSPADGATQIGSSEWFSFTQDTDGNSIGILDWHRDQAGVLCTGSVLFDNDAARRLRPSGPFWQVVSRDPLTLHPSLLCRTCGHHGWIRDGRWVAA